MLASGASRKSCFQEEPSALPNCRSRRSVFIPFMEVCALDQLTPLWNWYTMLSKKINSRRHRCFSQRHPIPPTLYPPTQFHPIPVLKNSTDVFSLCLTPTSPSVETSGKFPDHHGNCCLTSIRRKLQFWARFGSSLDNLYKITNPYIIKPWWFEDGIIWFGSKQIAWMLKPINSSICNIYIILHIRKNIYIRSSYFFAAFHEESTQPNLRKRALSILQRCSWPLPPCVLPRNCFFSLWGSTLEFPMLVSRCWDYPLVIQHSHGKWPIEIDGLPIKH